jgi:hypothetical protein
MRRAIAVLAVALLTLCSIDRAAAQVRKLPPEETEQPKKPVTKVSGNIRVMGNPSPLTDAEVILALVEADSSVTRKAISEVSADAAKDGEEVNVFWQDSELASPPGIVTLVVDVESFDKRVPAQSVLKKLPGILARRLPELDAAHQMDEEREEALTIQLALLKDEFLRAKEVSRTLSAIHRVPLTAEMGAQQRARLDEQIETNSVELEGLVARREALQSLIAEVGKKGAEEVDKDSVVAEMEKAVALRAEIVARVRESKAPSVDILAAESQLAEHKAELAKIRRDVIQAAGGQRLAELSRRLEDAAVEQAEVTARSKVLVKMRDSIGDSTQLELKRLNLELTESSYREVAKELDELQRKLRLYQPPKVTFLPAE